ncbi:hypothetical protein [Deinococcus pimensis]|uniref:hypothetical protein n=1 Tax=Deinococcus pimensis TaxID=309888 RepID=UPI0004838AC3|nr:hypothetical protein [Deinococcus pimensis]
MDFPIIPNEQLRLTDVPAADASWYEIGTFALKFNGYEHRGSFNACADLANAALETFEEFGGVPTDLTDLRTCLFFEQRRWRHFGDEPDEEAMPYIRALVEAIRQAVALTF